MTSLAHTVIKASAGSGKTFQLSNRLLYLILKGEKLDRILATTFTRKAAGEILSRVFQRLSRAAVSEQDAKSLSNELGFSVTQKKCADVLMEVVRNQHRLSICTMDSFCVKIAQTFGLELGLPPAWRIMDRDDEDRTLRDDAILELFSGLDADELAPMIRVLAHDTLRRAVHAEVHKRVTQLYDLFLRCDANAWGLPHTHEVTDDELKAILLKLESHDLPLTSKKLPDKRWEKTRVKSFQLVRDKNWSKLITQGIPAVLLNGGTSYFVPIVPSVQAIYRSCLEYARKDSLSAANRQTGVAKLLLTIFDEAYRKRKSSSGGLLFSDIKRALADATLKGGVEHLYYRLDSTIHHLLLDEFQDTSRDEWDVLLPLAEEILSQGAGERSFFCVGDVKQAIYGWRGGVAEIFGAIEGRWPHVELSTMEESRRSAPTIIEVVNKVFGSLCQHEGLQGHPKVIQIWEGRFRPHTTFKTNPTGYVAIETAEVAEVGSESGKQQGLTLKCAALRVQEVLKDAPDAVIGILTKKNATVGRLIYELRKFGILASEEGGSKISSSPPIAALISLLYMVDHPANTIARFHVAYSPLGKIINYTDYRSDSLSSECASRIRAQLVEDGYGVVLPKLAKELAQICSGRDAARLEIFARVSREIQPSLRPSQVARHLQDLKISSRKESAVRVMTVHQSKGLEFDYVVLPELDQLLLNSFRSGIVYQQDDLMGPITAIVLATSAAIALDEKLSAMKKQMEAKEITEALSVLYVAMTRAKYGLSMIIAPSKEFAKSSDPDKAPPIQKDPKAPPLTFAGIIRSAISDEYDLSELRPSSIVATWGDKNWWIENKEKNVKSQSTATKALTTGPNVEPMNRGFAHISPSDLTQSQALSSYNPILYHERNESKTRGTLIHRFFEEVGFLPDERPSKIRLRSLASTVTERQREDAISTFEKYLESPKILEAFHRSRYGEGELLLWRERAFAINDGNIVLRGAFDRVVLTVKSGKISSAEILDFKSDLVGSDAVDARTARYKPQFDAYKRALSSLISLPLEKVTCSVIYLAAGEVRSV